MMRRRAPIEMAVTVEALNQPLRSGRGDEENGYDREGQDQRADIFRACGKSGEDTEQDGATRRRLLQQPISAASASTSKAAKEISSLKRRACTTKSGVTALAAAAAKAGRLGSTSRARLKVANTMTPPARAPSTSTRWAKEGRSGGCSTSA